MPPITVIKRNILGQETYRYSGELLKHEPDHAVLEAFFDREDRIFHGMPLHNGDRFVETYYFDRWYNVFEIYAREDGELRGWYCNVSCPAEIDGEFISYVDLALDLLVFPDGSQIVLDEDEFSQLLLSQQDRERAQAALAELQSLFQR
jgi:hypothetical protein